MKRLHIVGCPRSGTTLMMELISTCFCNDGFCSHEMSIFEEPEGTPELFFSKQPSDIKYLSRIFSRDPNLYVIFLIRDPRAVIASRHSSHSDVYFCNYRVWEECYTAATGFLGHPRFLSVRYEDLTRNSDGIQAKIQERFPFLVCEHPFSEYQDFARPSQEAMNAMNGVRAVSAERIRGWREHLPRIKEQLQKYPEMVQVLIDSRYEADNEWTEELEGVAPVAFPCRYPDREPVLKRLDTRVRKWRQSNAYLRRRGC